MFFTKKIILLVLSFFIFFSCGYRFSMLSSFPEGVNSVFVSSVEDGVGELGLASRLTDDLSYVLMRSAQGEFTSDRDGADAVLEGRLLSLSESSLARSVADEDIERRLTLKVSFVLLSADGEKLWEGSFEDYEVYKVAKEKSVSKKYRKDALEVISLRIAESVVGRMGDNF